MKQPAYWMFNCGVNWVDWIRPLSPQLNFLFFWCFFVCLWSTQNWRLWGEILVYILAANCHRFRYIIALVPFFFCGFFIFFVLTLNKSRWWRVESRNYCTCCPILLDRDLVIYCTYLKSRFSGGEDPIFSCFVSGQNQPNFIHLYSSLGATSTLLT